MTAPNQPRQYSNTAVNTKIASASFTLGATSLVVESNAGYPTQYPFTLRINPGASNEEIVDVISGDGTVAKPWQVLRGRDNSIARAWTQGTPVVHGFTARDFAEIQQALVNAQSLISNAFPVGGIMMWSGSIDTIPNKYALCDGKSYNMTTGAQVTEGSPGYIKTPDLQNRFVYGASRGTTSGGKSPGSVGGSNTMTSTTMPSHTHTVDAHPATAASVSGGGHHHSMRYRPISDTATGNNKAAVANPGTGSTEFTSTGSEHSHTVTVPTLSHTVGATGGGGTQAENNMPQYYTLAYIMRVAA